MIASDVVFVGPKIDDVTPFGVIIATDLSCEDVENGDHELRFMLRCLRIPSLPAARIAAWPLGRPFTSPFIWVLLLLLEALNGGAPGLELDESEVGENKNDETESLGEQGFDSEEATDESEDWEDIVGQRRTGSSLGVRWEGGKVRGNAVMKSSGCRGEVGNGEL
jgi:hypothetical protein